MTVKVGIIGASFAKRAYLPALAVIPEVEVIAISSARKASAQSAAELFGIANVYDSWQQMLSSHKFDLVCIATPPNLHAPMSIAAMEHGADVLCEKPMAMSVSEAKKMLTTAVRLGRRHMVNHEMRFNPNRRKAQKLIKEGKLGIVRHAHVVSISSSWANPTSRPKGDWWSLAEAGGGRLGANGSHQIDLLRWWLGEVKSVCGETLTMIPDRFDEYTGELWTATADDVVHFMLYTEHNILATVFISSVARHNFGNHTQVFGSEGTILISNEDERLLYAEGDGPFRDISEADPNARLPGINQSVWEVSTVGAIKEFIRAIWEDRPLREGATFHDGLAVQRIMDAIRTSSNEKRWITVGQGDERGAKSE